MSEPAPVPSECSRPWSRVRARESSMESWASSGGVIDSAILNSERFDRWEVADYSERAMQRLVAYSPR